jgi:hypothetical protein
MCFIGSLCVFKVGFLVNNDRKNGDMARRFAFADDFLYVKLMTEKTRRRCCFVKSVYNVLLHRKFLFFNNVYLYIMP